MILGWEGSSMILTTKRGEGCIVFLMIFKINYDSAKLNHLWSTGLNVHFFSYSRTFSSLFFYNLFCRYRVLANPLEYRSPELCLIKAFRLELGLLFSSLFFLKIKTCFSSGVRELISFSPASMNSGSVRVISMCRIYRRRGYMALKGPKHI